MKRLMLFFIKIVVVMGLLSQTTTSDTGLTLITNQINEPISLTICGIGLLAFGLLGGQRKKSQA